jgi:hypothetical protein
MSSDTFNRIRTNLTFRPAIIAPIAIMIIFSIFNMTAPLDAGRVAQSITLGVVNLDTGVPGAPIRASDGIIDGMRKNLPFSVTAIDDEAAASVALERGDIAAAIIVPADFSKLAIGGGDITVKVLNTEHLSLAETQVGAGLGGQIQAAFSAAVSGARLAFAQGSFPTGALPVAVDVETLHSARNANTLIAPFVMAFATWIASFISGLMLFIATRGERGAGAAIPVAMLRTILPIAVAGVATLALAFIVAGTTALWGEFLGLWLMAWLATAAIMLVVGGLFSLLEFPAILLALPVVFYQTAVSGAQAPPEAALTWIGWLGDVLPLHDLVVGYRTLLIGGPEGALPIATAFLALVLGVVLVWVGTLLHVRLRPNRPAAAQV